GGNVEISNINANNTYAMSSGGGAGKLKYSRAYSSLINSSVSLSDLGSPIVAHPYDPDIVYYGSSWMRLAKGVYSAGSWNFSSISTSPDWCPVYDIAVSFANPNHILYSKYCVDNGEIGYSTDGGISFSYVTSSDLDEIIDLAHTSDIEFHNCNPDAFWITFSRMFEGKKIYYTENGGLSFTNITYEFPNTPVNCILYDHDNERLYVGTDAGIYFKEDGTTTWIEDGNLPYRMIITDMKLNKQTNKIMISTWGHGLWEAEISCDYIPDELVINTNTIWNCDKRLNRNVKVNNGVTLTINSKISFHPQACIIVDAGGKLIVDNGVLTNFCGGLWQGIEVWGNSSLSQTEANQGVIELSNGAKIENAECAVLLGKWKIEGYHPAFAGGIIRAEPGCEFRNNKTAIKFTPYNFDNSSYIYGCIFETTEQMPSEVIPSAFIDLIGVKGVNIKGNTFKNTNYENINYDKRGTGISSNGSKFLVNDYIESNVTYPSKFNNLCYGIKASNYLNVNSISIINTDFLNNYTGIKLSAVNYARIRNNSFEVNQQYTNDNSCGIYLQNSAGYSLYNNTFNTTDNGHYGIYVYGSGITSSLINNNNFTGLKTGIQADSQNKGLTLRCNSFTTMNGVDIAVTGSIKSKQGSCLGTMTGANNRFSYSGTLNSDIWTNPTVTVFNYSYNPSIYYHTTPQYFDSYKVIIIPCSNNYNPFTACLIKIPLTSVQLITEINSTKATLEALPKIDAGNTQNMLDVVYSDEAPGQIKETILAIGPYSSDTVLIAVTKRPGKPPLPSGIVKEIIVFNSPVTAKVMQAIATRVPALPAGTITEINNAQTGTSAREELENQIAYYEEQKGSATNELMQIYLFDTTIVNGMDSLITFLELQDDIVLQQQLVQAYLLVERCNDAKALLNTLPQQTQDDIYFYQFFNMLADKCIAGESIYELLPAQEQIVRDVANSGTTTTANAQALLTLVFGEYFPETFEPLIAPDSLNLVGFVSNDTLCGSQPVAGVKIYLLNSDSTQADIEPVMSDAQGKFGFNYFDLMQLGNTELYGFGYGDGSPVADLQFRIITAWMLPDIVRLVIPVPAVTIASDTAKCFGDTVHFTTSITGGLLPYTWKWNFSDGTESNAQNPAKLFIHDGTQTITLIVSDSTGCSDTAFYNVEIPAPIEIGIETWPATCIYSDGAAVATAENGTSPYTYIWNNGFTGEELQPVPAGEYIVTVTDVNGCTAQATAVIESVYLPGMVTNHWKISQTQGHFTGTLGYDDSFGYGAACIGDIDKDGIKDLAVGAPFSDINGMNNGAIYILFMKKDRTVKSFRRISSPELPLTMEGIFGTRVDTIGDLDRDGRTEIAVGADFDNDGGTYHGALWLISLNTKGGIKWYQKISDTKGNFTAPFITPAMFGSACAGLGDINHDGFIDIAVGMRRADTDRGAIYILFLGKRGIVKSYLKIGDRTGGFSGGLNIGDEFGRSIANVGDLNGDGIVDIAVGAFCDSDDGLNKGAVWLLFLNPNGTVKTWRRISDKNFDGVIAPGDYFGFSVESINKTDDINGDGVTDILVGSIYCDDGGIDRGAVWVLYLNSDGAVNGYQKLSSTEGCFTGQLDNYDHFGSSVTVMGNFAGDGTFNIAVGAAKDDDGVPDAGAVWLLSLEQAQNLLSVKSMATDNDDLTTEEFQESNPEKDILTIENQDLKFCVFPNPYRENTTINYELHRESSVLLEIYTLAGQKVITLANNMQGEGKYRYDFSAKRLGYKAGTYLLKININDNVDSYWLIEMN
ncbi:MAG: FG-GAP repeat protein, partial [Bacteroidia bacterium]|nr:FG-GAP repeat protein [Bacteroidia bacterium]